MSESGGAKFLRLLQALIEATREGRLDWQKVEGKEARERAHAKLHPADNYGPGWFDGSYLVQLPDTWIAFFPMQGHDSELGVAHEIQGKFVLTQTRQTADLFDDLRFLLTGGGDRQEALDVALAALKEAGT